MLMWVRGHAGHELNERVDGLANDEAFRAAQEIGWTPAMRFAFLLKGLPNAQPSLRHKL